MRFLARFAVCPSVIKRLNASVPTLLSFLSLRCSLSGWYCTFLVAQNVQDLLLAGTCRPQLRRGLDYFASAVFSRSLHVLCWLVSSMLLSGITEKERHGPCAVTSVLLVVWFPLYSRCTSSLRSLTSYGSFFLSNARTRRSNKVVAVVLVGVDREKEEGGGQLLQECVQIMSNGRASRVKRERRRRRRGGT